MYDGSKEVEASRPKDIYKFLENAGFEVYFQGQHRGKCTSKYVVIVSRGDVKIPGISSTTSTVELLCYVPVREAPSLEEFCESVKETMKQMYPMIHNMYNDIGDYIDDEISGAMRTIQYNYYRKIER